MLRRCCSGFGSWKKSLPPNVLLRKRNRRKPTSARRITPSGSHRTLCGTTAANHHNKRQTRGVKSGRSLNAAFIRAAAIEADGLKNIYIDFMVEYLALGHMDSVVNEEGPLQDSFYLPYHAVFKDGSHSGKIRVVFNAFYRSSTGHSNDLLLPGPKLQSDLWLILIRW